MDVHPGIVSTLSVNLHLILMFENILCVNLVGLSNFEFIIEHLGHFLLEIMKLFMHSKQPMHWQHEVRIGSKLRNPQIKHLTDSKMSELVTSLDSSIELGVVEVNIGSDLEEVTLDIRRLSLK
jgi:hypothetical protein